MPYLLISQDVLGGQSLLERFKCVRRRRLDGHEIHISWVSQTQAPANLQVLSSFPMFF